MSTGSAVAKSSEYRYNSRRETRKGRGMFKNLIVKWADAILEKEMGKSVPVLEASGPSLDAERGITFTVYKARGGTVVETRTYDSLKDRSQRGLYVITDEQNMGNEISKIITMESLKA